MKKTNLRPHHLCSEITNSLENEHEHVSQRYHIK